MAKHGFWKFGHTEKSTKENALGPFQLHVASNIDSLALPMVFFNSNLKVSNICKYIVIYIWRNFAIFSISLNDLINSIYCYPWLI